ncbi:MAG: glycosyltransferase family 2 protein [Deltaproteobacteria bacterium]|nr:glycosyltransferase family 2 protein [Deltaproteobacteria bacterium]
MELKDQPLVSIVTPVYNGERYLPECVEGVLAQTYGNWEHIIVNNSSADRTLETARRYAAKDSRIRVHDNKDFLGIIENHNNALKYMSPESKYCIVLHADDTLMPECLMKKVRLAEANPSVGVVGSYWIHGDHVSDGPPYPVTVIPGREVCRMYLFDEKDLLGPTATMLIRSGVIRAAGAFFNESNLSADKEAVCDVLNNADFGFVHQVLAYYRNHDQQSKRSEEARGVMFLGKIFVLKKYGRDYMQSGELERYLKKEWRKYYGFLGRHVYLLREKKFMENNKKALSDLGYSFSPSKLLGAMSLKAIDTLLNPVDSMTKIMRRL